MAKARGVDISSCQGSCDFPALLAGGFDFAIEKGTEGVAKRDPTFERRIAAARTAGVLVPLAYHVLTPTSPIDAQLGNCLDFLLTYDVDVCLDFELADPGMTVGQRCMRALAFAEGVKKAGRKVVVYSFPNFMRQLSGSSALVLLAQLAEYWAADYPNERKQPEDTANPWVPGAWGGKWSFWQWSGNGGTGAPGIPAIVDHTIFNGTREDLYNWVQGSKSESGPGDPNPSGSAAH
jgi:GH25 family lysozyme M1 (1,4-beta-N-acetylmuramidase)